MLRTVILLQLTLWVVSIHAFFPYIPAWQCEENNICGDDPKSEKPKARGVQTYKLSQRVRNANSDPSASAAKEASRLLRKYRPSRIEPEAFNLGRRENQYRVIPPATPSTPNSAGIYQDGTDFSYFIQVGLGSSGKPLYMLLDTGAGTTWVMGSNCKTEACSLHNNFDPSTSKTYANTEKTFHVSYGAGAVSGVVGKDTITLAGMSVNMGYGVANDTSASFKNFPFDGILGVSMSQGATDNFLGTVKTSSALKSQIFGVSLSRNSDGPNTGEVNFGGIDSSQYTGDISYAAVAKEAGGDWAIKMDDLAYDGKNAGVKGRVTYIDTGTSYIFGPPDDVAALHKLIPGAKSDDGFTYTVPCDSHKVLTVSIAGVAYNIAPNDWMSPPVGDRCTSNFYGYAVVEGTWLLGDSFLKNVYSVFDFGEQPRIGFGAKSAPPLPSATTSKTEVASTTATSASDGSSPTTLETTTTPASGTPTSESSLPGLSGHETAAAQGTTPVAQTAGSSASPTASSPGEQLEGNRYASIICIVAVIAMVA